jgi:hypothetical protein
MRRIVGVLLVAALAALAGCGGTAWDSHSGAPAAPPTRQPTKAKATAAAERPYIEALAANTYLGDTNATEAGKRAISHCLAEAVVHGYGTAAFDAAGLSPAALSGPKVSLAALPLPTEAQIASIGTALQSCPIGGLYASALLNGMKVTDDASVLCLSARLHSAPEARRLLTFLEISRHLDLLTAHIAISLIGHCVDLPAFLLSSPAAGLDATTKTCMLAQLRTIELQIEDYFAELVAGTKKASSDILLAARSHCRAGTASG